VSGLSSSIRGVFSGESDVGTLFISKQLDAEYTRLRKCSLSLSEGASVAGLAEEARAGGRALAAQPAAVRTAVLNKVEQRKKKRSKQKIAQFFFQLAELLELRVPEILAANEQDVRIAQVRERRMYR